MSIFILFYFSDSDPSLDWMVKHGRGIALSVALKESPEKLCKQFDDNISKTILELSSSDRVCVFK